MDVVLVHSPLVGPGTWGPVATELGRRGRLVAVPVVGPDALPDWRPWVDEVCRVVRAMPGRVIVAGHSGGGIVLPLVATAAREHIGCLLFVDSDVPQRGGESPVVPAAFREFLAGLADERGTLPPWPAWWDDAAMRELIPDDDVRAAVAAEAPALPLAYFDERIPSPVGWDDVPCGYLQLSDAYADAAATAGDRDWPVESIEGAQHMHPVVAPGEVADTMLRLAGRLDDNARERYDG
jgi:Alpha/beta hydrolase family